MVSNQPDPQAYSQREGNNRHANGKGADSAPGIHVCGSCPGKTNIHNICFENQRGLTLKNLADCGALHLNFKIQQAVL